MDQVEQQPFQTNQSYRDDSGKQSFLGIMDSSPIILIIHRMASAVKSNFNPPWAAMVLVVALIALIKLFTQIKQRYRRRRIFEEGNLPSLDYRNPISGNLYDIYVPQENIKIIDKYHKKLGKTFGAFYASDPWVITMDLEVLEKVWVSRHRQNTNSLQLHMPYIEHSKSIVQLKDDNWRRLRKLMDPYFSPKQMKSDNVFRDIEVACDRIMECIDGHPIESDTTGSRGRIVDVVYNCKKYSVEVIYKVAFGYENGVNMAPGGRDKMIDLIHVGENLLNCNSAWITVMFHEQLQYFVGLLVKYTILGKSIQYIHEVLESSLIRRRGLLLNQTGGSGKHSSTRIMLDSLIETVDKGNIDEETLKANLAFFFLAGFDTTGNTLIVMFWYLAQRQDVQEKLRDSIKNGLENTQYLDWCIYESLRLFPAVTLTGRTAGEDITTSKGQTIFKGTSIMPSIYSIHHCEEYWGSDVEEFRPERFGEDNIHPMQFFAFGKGPRGCIGKNLAMAELRAIFTRVLVKYRVEPTNSTPDELKWTSPNLIVMTMERPINLKFIEITSR